MCSPADLTLEARPAAGQPLQRSADHRPALWRGHRRRGPLLQAGLRRGEITCSEHLLAAAPLRRTACQPVCLASTALSPLPGLTIDVRMCVPALVAAPTNGRHVCCYRACVLCFALAMQGQEADDFVEAMKRKGIRWGHGPDPGLRTACHCTAGPSPKKSFRLVASQQGCYWRQAWAGARPHAAAPAALLPSSLELPCASQRWQAVFMRQGWCQEHLACVAFHASTRPSAPPPHPPPFPQPPSPPPAACPASATASRARTTATSAWSCCSGVGQRVRLPVL